MYGPHLDAEVADAMTEDRLTPENVAYAWDSGYTALLGPEETLNRRNSD